MTATGLLLLVTSAAWPVAALVRGRRAGGPGTAARVTAGATALLAVTCAVGVTLLFLDPTTFMTAVLQDAPVVPWVFAPLTLAAAVRVKLVDLAFECPMKLAFPGRLTLRPEIVTFTGPGTMPTACRGVES